MSEEQNVYVAMLNKVRKLWVSKISDTQKENLKAFEQKERFIKYQKIDSNIVETYTKLLYNERQNEGKINTDSVLEKAVELVIAKL